MSSNNDNQKDEGSKFLNGAVEYRKGKDEAERAEIKELQLESLSEQPEIEIWKWSRCGLFLNKIFQGSTMGFVWSRQASYPFFGVYLNMDGHAYNSVRAVLMIVWAFKLISSVFTDSVPILKRRRIPYMAIGWILATLGYLSGTILTYPEPYYGVTNCTRDTSVVLNPNAQSEGVLYVLVLGVALFGIGVTDVASDALAVEYARREPVKTRGRIMAYVHIFNWLGGLLLALPIAVGMNTVKYGGPICNDIITFQHLLFIFAAYSICALLATLLVTYEEKITKTGASLKSNLSGMWHTMQSSAFVRILLYFAIEVPLSEVKSSAVVKIKKNYAQVEPSIGGMSGLLNIILCCGVMAFYAKFLVNYSWRKLAFAVKVPAILIGLTVELLTIFDVVRNQYFYVIAEETCVMVFFAVLMYLMIMLATEICDENQEGMTFGLIMSVWTIGSPLSTAIGNVTSAPFGVTDDSRFISDTFHDRLNIAGAVLCAYVCNALSLLAIYYLLPDQKEHVQKMKREASHTKQAGIGLAVTLIVFFFIALTFNVLAALPSTQCLLIVGGLGC